ncbi:MAG: M23 family metallopeptidase [Spirochaetaceae bacterium]|nr:M23 family metallopeptidase [Spirochaetaceae bacterium]
MAAQKPPLIKAMFCNYSRESRARLRRGFFFTFTLILPLLPLESEEPAYPRITALKAQDPLFLQYQQDVEAGRRAAYNRRARETNEEIAQKLTLYTYTAQTEDDLIRLAARCVIPYAAIATLNQLEHGTPLDGRLLLLPSMPGLFIREDGGSDFERLLLASRAGEGVQITISAKAKTRLLFFPGDDFTSTERALFLHPNLFRFPLQKYTITSRFGSRANPFNGKPSKHAGLDLAAPLGTEVFAVREGAVSFTGENAVYGNYVIITHDNGWTSLYGHLSRIETAQGRKVGAGTLIGKVGSTGLSTGPHLHFELRQNGQAQDPARLLGKN